ncbi:MAG: NAD(P)-dependent oxidoreductase [Mycobacteriales bacterium]
MKVLIAGARSALGSRVSLLLRADGHDVVGLSRTPAQGFVTADVLDSDAVRRAVAEAVPDALVQTLNALPKSGPRRLADLAATGRLRTDGTRNLLTAARAAGVTKYVAENFFFGYGTTGNGSLPLTEDSPFEAAGNPAVAQDEQVRDFGGVSLRCGLFYGPGVGSTESLADAVRRRRMPVVRGAQNVVSHLHIDDAAAAVVAALHEGKPGAAYNIADDEPAGMHDFVRELARQLGASQPYAVPLWVVRAAAGAYAAGFLTSNLAIDNGKAKRDLGWSPAYPSIRDGLKTVAAGRLSSAV